MKRTCAYPGCGGGFEAKRSDARYCSDTCRAKASKDRARARREGAGRRSSVAPAALSSLGELSALAERLATMEQRLAAAEAGVGRAEADRAVWREVRDQLRAALARAGGSGAMSHETIAAAVRAEVGPQLAKLGKRLDGVEAAQATLREDLAKAAGGERKATAKDLMMVGKAVGKLTTRVSIIERDVRVYGQGVSEALGEDVAEE